LIGSLLPDVDRSNWGQLNHHLVLKDEIDHGIASQVRCNVMQFYGQKPTQIVGYLAFPIVVDAFSNLRVVLFGSRGLKDSGLLQVEFLAPSQVRAKQEKYLVFFV
jgi:hypothetical protein